ncbi:MAG: tRNA uridine-5-carboxymethylaminomethyl(34) synthesis enzyme MnmG [Bacilli bacterium]
MLIKTPSSYYDVIVVGGGHAGVEAANAACTLGMKTLMVCFNFKMVSNMACNPTIGGSAKGIVVREMDVLGGVMGKLADMKGSILQMKVLNTSKGPGVRCFRAQEDKRGYPRNVQNFLLTLNNLDIIEHEVKRVVVENKIAKGILLDDGTFISCKAIVLATGTHMEARTLRGHVAKDEGPDGEKSSHGLSKSISDLGLNMIRLKTGTPPRLDPKSIDYSVLEIEEGDEGHNAFSYDTTWFLPKKDMLPCHLTYTNEHTHEIIRAHLKDSAMYGGVVRGVGPRYCPSIEDKVVRFADKKRHQLFLEPESIEFSSCYLQGFSTSMPENIQVEMVHSLKGLEKAVFLKYAYAIEYDAVEPSQLDHTMRVKGFDGLYVCGQIAGTSGYEEAAALGLMAGINASLWILGKAPFTLGRDEAYMGIMIDDIVTKGTHEPYRLLSSRSEYRLITRNDNADTRLIQKGYDIGMVPKDRFDRLNNRNVLIFNTIKTLEEHQIASNKKIREYLLSLGFNEPNGNENLKLTMRRQNVKYSELRKCVDFLPELDEGEQFKIETEIKYEGYIIAERKEAERRKGYESLLLPDGLDYKHMDGLSLEAREKLTLLRPKTLGEASRITNVHPSDIDVLSFYVRHQEKK